MKPVEFCYWLQGFFELSGDDVTVSQRQIEIIKDHLKLVFKKETPNLPATGSTPPSGEEGWHTLLPEIQKRGGPLIDPHTPLYCHPLADNQVCYSHMPSC